MAQKHTVSVAKKTNASGNRFTYTHTYQNVFVMRAHKCRCNSARKIPLTNQVMAGTGSCSPTTLSKVEAVMEHRWIL